MTHEVLPRVVDVASPYANRDDGRRLKWRLALLSCLELYYLLYIFM